MTDVRVSQVAVEVIRTNNAVSVQLSQLAVEVLRPNAAILHTATGTDTLTTTDTQATTWTATTTIAEGPALSITLDTEIIAAPTGGTTPVSCSVDINLDDSSAGALVTSRSLTDSAAATDANFFGFVQSITDSASITDATLAWRVLNLFEALTMDDVPSPTSYFYRTASDQLELARALATKVLYKPVSTDAVVAADPTLVSWPKALAESLGVASPVVVSRALRVVEALRLGDVLGAKGTYTWSVSDSVRALDLLARFVAGDVVEGLTTADLVSRTKRMSPVATAPLALTDVVSRKLVIRLISSEGVDLTSAQALKLLLKPTLAETVTISLAYIAPGDSVTTWAVNTRTGATTEYTGYNFNSFAEFGRSYVAASSSGLYELKGDTDDGDDIIAKIKSGLGQFAGSRLTHIKGAYIGVRGSGDFLLRIETTDGKTHTYGLTVGSMKTHKVNMGKGIRARYFAYELESTGQDFDLENIKFVPLIAQRRV